jgi:hypothetical protein
VTIFGAFEVIKEFMPIRLAQVHLIAQSQEIADLATTGQAFEHP